jgi:hypothetical protein
LTKYTPYVPFTSRKYFFLEQEHLKNLNPHIRACQLKSNPSRDPVSLSTNIVCEQGNTYVISGPFEGRETPFLKLGKKFIISTVVSEDSKKREGTVCRRKEFLIEINLEDTGQETS